VRADLFLLRRAPLLINPASDGFPGSAIGRLDWPPMAEIAAQVRIYRPEDRDRYLRGTLPPTEFVP